MKQRNNCVKLNEYFLIAVVLLFVLIAIKIIYIAVSPVVDGVDLKALALQNRTVSKTLRANRGTIYDDSGEVLAQDVRSYTVIAYLSAARTTNPDNPQHVIDKNETALLLSEHLEMTPEYIYGLLNKDSYQVELGPGGRNITELKKQTIEALDLPGIDFIKDSKRDYPNGDFASYIVGYARKNDIGEITGEMGIESKYNDKLKGTDGSVTYQKDAYGYRIAGTPEYPVDAIDGHDIYLTIDSNIQMYLQNAMMDLEKYSIDWGTITVADAKTGAIVGSSAYPSFNPNILKIENYTNPLTSYTYEPGSTMKIFSFMAAMEHGKYNGDDTFSSGHIMVDNYKINDWNNQGWGEITYNKGFVYSSNTATVRLAQSLGRDLLTDFYEKLGFGSKTGIELPGEYTGKIEMVYESELASAAYGQGITTTPIQNIQALTALTNNGVTMKPYIISKIVDPNTGEVIHEGKKTELNKVASEVTINQILDLMDEVVNGTDPVATGKHYHTDSLTLVGKTGTAQYTTASGKYSSGTYNNIRSFAGVFPKEDPEYIIFLSAKDFVGSSADLASITKSIVESIAKYKNIEDRNTDTDQNKIIKVNNYINKNINKVKAELESIGLVPIVIGQGEKIIKQSIVHNTSVITGTKIILITNGGEYIMPDVSTWTSNEIINLANILKISYNISGFGKVQSVSIPPGSLLSGDSVLDIILDSRSVVNGKKEEKKEE